MDEQDLLERAREARLIGYAPYSDYRVGAALYIPKLNRLVTGANTEEHGRRGIHAEQMAVYRAVQTRAIRLDHLKTDCMIAVVGRDGDSHVPCGSCLHTFAEFFEELNIVIPPEDRGDGYEMTTLEQELPNAYRGGRSRGD